jgi:hypothetical protein
MAFLLKIMSLYAKNDHNICFREKRQFFRQQTFWEKMGNVEGATDFKFH